MEKNSQTYSLGDLIVHRSYGVGQIDSIECRLLNGIEVECFKVKTENGTYWFPTETIDNPRIHPIASQKHIQQAIEILRSTPQDLENDPRQWKSRIDDVQSEGDFLAISSLVRDLSALKKKKKLNRTQEQALKNLEGRLLKEWAASVKIGVNSIRSLLKTYL